LEFIELNEELELAPILDQLAGRPPLVAGGAISRDRGLSVALARSFKILDPKLKSPSTEHWQRSFQIFELLL
jgi:hypothetical protein